MAQLHHVRLLRDCRSIGARIACGEVNLSGVVPDHGCPLADREGERFDESDLMTALCKCGADLGRDRLLHVYVAAREGLFGKARLFECGLDVHAVIDDVRYELCVSLRLVPTAHDAEADADVVLLQEGRDWEGAERALRDVLELEPQHGETKHNLNVLLRRLGREPLAV